MCIFATLVILLSKPSALSGFIIHSERFAFHDQGRTLLHNISRAVMRKLALIFRHVRVTQVCAKCATELAYTCCFICACDPRTHAFVCPQFTIQTMTLSFSEHGVEYICARDNTTEKTEACVAFFGGTKENALLSILIIDRAHANVCYNDPSERNKRATGAEFARLS